MTRFNKLLVVIAGLAGLSMPVRGHAATVLTFDDVPGGSIQNEDFSLFTYKGFNFTGNLFWIDVEGSFQQNWAFGAHSGEFAMLCNFWESGVVTEASGADFTFDGLWAKRWRMPPESGGEDSLFGYFSGRKDGQELWRVNTGLNGSYKYFSPQPAIIDELILAFGRAEPLGTWLVDDLVLSKPLAPGDFNGDHAIDAADLEQWKIDFGSSANSDADGDGASDGNDLLIWQRNLGANSSEPTHSVVPEPVTWHLGAIAIMMHCCRRPNRAAGLFPTCRAGG